VINEELNEELDADIADSPVSYDDQRFESTSSHFGLDYKMENDGFDTSYDHYESSALSQTTNKLLQLSCKLNYWSSKFIVKDGDKYIDVSSAAQGCSSIIPERQVTEISNIQELSISLTIRFSMTLISMTLLLIWILLKNFFQHD